MTNFRTYDGTILKEGRKYLWSGFKEGLYNDFTWVDFKCKIVKIDGIFITIYDYDDNKEYDFVNKGLEGNNVTFKKIKWYRFW